MELTVTQEQARVPVTIISVAGHLDGQSYQSLIKKAREVFESVQSTCCWILPT